MQKTRGTQSENWTQKDTGEKGAGVHKFLTARFLSGPLVLTNLFYLFITSTVINPITLQVTVVQGYPCRLRTKSQIQMNAQRCFPFIRVVVSSNFFP